MKYSKFIVALIILLNVVFTSGVLYVNLKGSAVSDALVAGWFGFTATELWQLASIKKEKVKGERRK